MTQSPFMDWLSQWVFMNIPAFLFVLMIVIFFHELGHFLVARWCGVGVSTFSIGFGREVFGWNDRHGTRWRLSWIPLGGYVKFIDDDNAASLARSGQNQVEPAGAADKRFHTKPLWRRAAVVAAGPLANFVLAIAIFTGWFMANGERITEPVVTALIAGGAAEKAGFKPGDRVLEVEGIPIDDFSEIGKIVTGRGENELSFVIERTGSRITLRAKPDWQTTDDGFGNEYRRYILGIRHEGSEQSTTTRTFTLPQAVARATDETWFVVSRTFLFLKNLVIGKESAKQLVGPVKIAEVTGKVAAVGVTQLIYLIGLLSVSIGLFNLFPIPILDGGNLLFYGIEAIRQRPVSERTQEIGFKVGLAILGMLMVFVMTKDVLEQVRTAMGL